MASIIEAIDAFAKEMKTKALLRADRHGLELEFDDSPKAADWYFYRMIEELGELAKEARQPKPNLESMMSECADVANFAACLAAVLRSSIANQKIFLPIPEGMPTK